MGLLCPLGATRKSERALRARAALSSTSMEREETKLHLTTKEVVATEDQSKKLKLPVGTHIVTTVLEADGPNPLASKDAKFDAEVISVQRTDSGGVQIQVAVAFEEPAPAVAEAPAPAAPEPTLSDAAVAYFVDKGFTKEDAEKQVSRFGVGRVIAMRDKQLDEELATVVAKASE